MDDGSREQQGEGGAEHRAPKDLDAVRLHHVDERGTYDDRARDIAYVAARQ
ncbi:hypothetical protein [Streptomyces clavifer]|uniref:hypothetical protein n=1 Tax=Streptomyces clavifer TaxID=68188 RepID=UPI0036C7574A